MNCLFADFKTYAFLDVGIATSLSEEKSLKHATEGSILFYCFSERDEERLMELFKFHEKAF